MKTNLDRLHAVAETREDPPRRAGKTFYDCHCVAGAIEVGEKLILVTLPSMQWIEHVRPMLADVLKDHALKFTAKRYDEWYVDGPDGAALIYFRLSGPSSNEPDGLWHDAALIDFDDSSQFRVDESGMSEGARKQLGRYSFEENAWPHDPNTEWLRLDWSE
jgi:hypothetical protein